MYKEFGGFRINKSNLKVFSNIIFTNRIKTRQKQILCVNKVPRPNLSITYYNTYITSVANPIQGAKNKKKTIFGLQCALVFLNSTENIQGLESTCKIGYLAQSTPVKVIVF